MSPVPYPSSQAPDPAPAPIGLPSSGHERAAVVVLAAAVVALCGGYAWQCLRWDAPVWTILWDQSLMSTPVEVLFGMDWETWASSRTVESSGRLAVRIWGLGFILGAVAAILWPLFNRSPGRMRTILKVVLCATSASLALWAVLNWLDHGLEIPGLPEKAVQVLAPLLLACSLRLRDLPWRTTARLALSATFLGHACYALGWPRLPGHFVTMLINGLGLPEPAAVGVLHLVGVLDTAAVVAIWWRPSATAGLLWMIAWGFATAAARVVGNVEFAFLASGLEQWLHQCLLRLIHGALPLAILITRTHDRAAVPTTSSPVNQTPRTEPS